MDLSNYPVTPLFQNPIRRIEAGKGDPPYQNRKDVVSSNLRAAVKNVIVTETDVISYWMSLFPGLSDAGKLERMFADIGEKTLEAMLQEAAAASVPSTVEVNVSILEDRLDVRCNDPFWPFYEPIIREHALGWRDHLRNARHAVDPDVLFEQSVFGLAEQLAQMALRVLIVELHAAKLTNRLSGTTPEERFGHFVRKLADEPDFLGAMYAEYHELVRLMRLKSHTYFHLLKEVLERTEAGRDDLARTFNAGRPLGRLCGIRAHLGDSHQGGRSVVQLRFECGTNLVYKPRSLEAERAFASLVNWLNEQAPPGWRGLRAAETLAEGEYGWMLWVENSPCADETQIRSFYVRAGHLLCLLYALNGRDIHHENVLADGDCPIPVDLESLLHPLLPSMLPDAQTDAERRAWEVALTSVQSVGLLPTFITGSTEEGTIRAEVGGLGAETEQFSPFLAYTIRHPGTDGMKLEKTRAVIAPHRNLPVWGGRPQSADRHVDEIVTGFRTLYEWIAENRETFAAEVENLFSAARCRVIFRPTYLYSQLLRTGYHPDMLRNPVHRRVLFHRLGLSAERIPKPVVRAEYEDLLDGDVPYFALNVGDTTVFDSRGRALCRLPTAAPLEAVKEKISRFGADDMARQTNMIRTSFLVKAGALRLENTPVRLHGRPLRNAEKIERNLKEFSILLGEYLLSTAITDRPSRPASRTWISASLSGPEQNLWSVAPIGLDLFNGLPGIALFLGCLAVVTDRAEFARAASETAAAFTLPFDPENAADAGSAPPVGAFAGAAGAVYALFHLGTVLRRPDLRARVPTALCVLEKLLETSGLCDVVAGAAGCLGVAMAVFERTDDRAEREAALRLARRSVEMLKRNARRDADGTVAWPDFGQDAYIGYAHGAIGIAAQLARLLAVDADAEISSLVQGALQLVRSRYDPTLNNWHSRERTAGAAWGWCHGAPGILLALCNMRKTGYRDELLEEDIRTAFEATVRYGFGHNLTLCHGDWGNLDIVRTAAEQMKWPKWPERCRDAVDEACRWIMRLWREGVPQERLPVGLMVGLAGCGYAALRFSAPDLVPDVLSLA